MASSKVAHGGYQSGERAQQHAASRTGHGAVRVGHRDATGSNGHVDGERREGVEARARRHMSPWGWGRAAPCTTL